MTLSRAAFSSEPSGVVASDESLFEKKSMIECAFLSTKIRVF